MSRKYEMLSGDELITVTNNINNIEHFLGHKMPTNLVNIEDLKDHSLSGSELIGVVEDIKRIERLRGSKNKNRNSNSFDIVEVAESIFMTGFLIIVVLYFFGIDVLGWIASLLY